MSEPFKPVVYVDFQEPTGATAWVHRDHVFMVRDLGDGRSFLVFTNGAHLTVKGAAADVLRRLETLPDGADA